MNSEEIEKLVDAALDDIRRQIEAFERNLETIETQIAEIASQLDNLKSGM